MDHYSGRKKSGKIRKMSASTDLCPCHPPPWEESVRSDEKRQHPKIYGQGDSWAKGDETNKKPEKN